VEFKFRANITNAEADFGVTKSLAEQRAKTAKVQADAAVEEERQKQAAKVSLVEALAKLEADRAEKAAPETVGAEVRSIKAAGEAKALEIESNAKALQIQIVANANLMAEKTKAAGELAHAEAKAKGEQKLLAAQANGIKQLAASCPEETLVEILQIQHGIPQAKADSAAKAVQGLNPHIFSITGDPMAVVGRLIASLAPFSDLVSKVLKREPGTKKE
jgi:hypothetical protein